MPDPSSSSSGTLSSWLQKGSWSVLDQGLFAVSNFAVNVLLARWLTPVEYGAFTLVSFVVLLLIGVLHTGMLTEPMLVFGPGTFQHRRKPYLREILKGHALFTLAVGPIVLLVGWASTAVGHPELTLAIYALAVAQGAILLMWLLRRACYLFFRPDLAVVGGLSYVAATAAGLAGLVVFDALSAPTAILLMAGASLVAVIVIVLLLRVYPARERADGLREEILAAHKGYTGWASATGGLEWVQGLLPFLVLPIWYGLESAGVFRALFNLVMPVMQAYSALSLLLVPTFVRARADGRLRRVLVYALVPVVAVTIGYGLVIGVWGRPLLDVLYGGQYTAHAGLLWMFALYPIAGGVATVLSALRRAEERPKAVFRARGGAAGLMATVGTALIWAMGLAGAILADILASVTEVILLANARVRTRASAHESEPTDDLLALKSTPGTSDTTDVILRSDDIPHSPSYAGGDGSLPRLKVLMGAFACCPGKGSEPGIGWHFARLMALRHDVWVLTYAGFRKQIEAALAVDTVKGLHFVYYTLPFEHSSYTKGRRRRSGLNEQFHYHAWQIGAARVAKRLHLEVGFDVVHHVTYAKFWAPSALAGLDAPFIWGPVGGGEAAPRSFYGRFTRAALRYERARDTMQALMQWEPNVRRTARRADLAFATTEETLCKMEGLGATCVQVHPSIAVHDDEAAALAAAPPPADGPLRFLSIGRMISYKGFDLGLRAFTDALARDTDGVLDGARFEMIGEGMEREALERLVAELGLQEQVEFTGALALADVHTRLQQGHVLVHPSLHESGGGVCLEAMAAARPVVCLALGGPKELVPPEAGILIAAKTPEQTITALADALLLLAADPALRGRMGEVGRRHVLDNHCWSERVRFMEAHYREVAHCSVPPPAETVTASEYLLQPVSP